MLQLDVTCCPVCLLSVQGLCRPVTFASDHPVTSSVHPASQVVTIYQNWLLGFNNFEAFDWVTLARQRALDMSRQTWCTVQRASSSSLESDDWRPRPKKLLRAVWLFRWWQWLFMGNVARCSTHQKEQVGLSPVHISCIGKKWLSLPHNRLSSVHLTQEQFCGRSVSCSDCSNPHTTWAPTWECGRGKRGQGEWWDIWPALPKAHNHWGALPWRDIAQQGWEDTKREKHQCNLMSRRSWRNSGEFTEHGCGWSEQWGWPSRRGWLRRGFGWARGWLRWGLWLNREGQLSRGRG